MCGIVGIIHTDGHPLDPALIEHMCQSIVHRGPNEQGLHVAGSRGFGMCRLAIIDVAGGQQPLHNEDGTIEVIFNGEIYNFQALRGELQQLGHRFTTNSDTEVIVHAYEQWGDEALQRFNGMFAFALWDEPKQRLLITRDRLGEKPVYWHYGPQGLAWGSEAKALLRVPWIPKAVNPLALHHYLTLQYTPDPLTIWEGIHQIPAAHKLVLEQGRSPKITRWWQLQFQPKWEGSEGEFIEQAQALLKAAVRQRLIAEVPLGAFLSGGINSSLIVALMAEEMREPVKTFSIGFEERHYSELGYAAQVAHRWQTDHHEFVFRPTDLVRVIDGVVAACDEPLADPAALPLYELARQTRQHVTVALSGDGGDETLAGYRRYALDRVMQPYAALPGWFTQKVVPATASWLPDPNWLPEDRNPLAGARRLGQVSAVTQKASLVRWGSYFSHTAKLGLYTERWHDAFATTDTTHVLAQAFDEAQAATLLDCTLHADHVTYLAGDLLPKTDRMTMAHSVEARAPFLDADWVAWTARLPQRYKVRGMQTKWLLKAAFRDKLPAGIAARGKQGFAVPVGMWLRHDIRQWAHERLLSNALLDEWFRPSVVRQLLDEHDAGRINHGKRLWALLMFALWLERYQG